MDPLERADQVLARAKARRAGIVTPDSATSPMDQTSTVQIPWTRVAAADPRAAEPDNTVAIPTVVFGRETPTDDDFGPARPRR